MHLAPGYNWHRICDHADFKRDFTVERKKGKNIYLHLQHFIFSLEEHVFFFLIFMFLLLLTFAFNQLSQVGVGTGGN